MDIKCSLRACGLSHRDVRGVYVSHAHPDHIAGLGYLAIAAHFDPEYDSLRIPGVSLRKPRLFVPEPIYYRAARLLEVMLDQIGTGLMRLEDWFDVRVMKRGETYRYEELELSCNPVPHFLDKHTKDVRVNSHALTVQTYTGSTLFTTDMCTLLPESTYRAFDMVVHDMEYGSFHSGVHTHYDDLKLLPPDIKAKTWLTHWGQQKNIRPPRVKRSGFAGLLRQNHVYTLP